MSSAGSFIVLEGIDGCGSTTQARLLAQALRGRGRGVVETAEPSSGAIGQLIRQALAGTDPALRFDWTTMALLFAADRLHHVRQEIEPALAAGNIVVCDRYDLSSLTYQSATAPAGQDVSAWIASLNHFARRPDWTIVLDVDPDLAEQRRAARGGPREIFERSELQRTLAGLYAQAEILVPGDRLLHVAAEGTPEEVLARLQGALSSLFS